ncbi:SKP1-like protein 11 [Lotus japonicus]|uniref:SKP1-like protein 11 n=1 Tax=Lotus japonicus TaxID=34305 RepID=UPI002588D3DF|nr:SKP1-like protein 11 [Lotus japonicus]
MAAEASSSSSSSKMISLKTADGEIFEVEPSIAKQMQTVQNFIDDIDSNAVIPLPEIKSRELVNIIEYCKHHRAADDDKDEANKDKEEGKDFDAEFAKALSYDELWGLCLAANYLNMKELLDFVTQTIANGIQNKNVEFMRKLFGIIDIGYTKEEEEALRQENAWAFEGVDPDETIN